MSVVVVNLTDSIDIWRQKTNSNGANIGDIDTLVTQPTQTNCVDAINEAFATIASSERRLLARAWFIN